MPPRFLRGGAGRRGPGGVRTVRLLEWMVLSSLVMAERRGTSVRDRELQRVQVRSQMAELLVGSDQPENSMLLRGFDGTFVGSSRGTQATQRTTTSLAAAKRKHHAE